MNTLCTPLLGKRVQHYWYSLLLIPFQVVSHSESATTTDGTSISVAAIA